MTSVNELPQPEVEVRLAASRENVGFVRHVLAGFGDAGAIDRDTLSRIVLAVSEAVTDAVLHGGARGRLVVRAWRSEDELCVSVRDTEHPRPALDTASLHAGLPTIAAVAQRVEVRSADDGGSEVLMSFAL